MWGYFLLMVIAVPLAIICICYFVFMCVLIYSTTAWPKTATTISKLYDTISVVLWHLFSFLKYTLHWVGVIRK